MAYRDEIEALRARLEAVQSERDAATREVRRLEAALSNGVRRVERRVDPRWYSVRGGEPTSIEVINDSARKVEALWLSYDGHERSAGTLIPGGSIRTQTYVGHCWRIVDATTGEILCHARVETADSTVRYADAPEDGPVSP